MNAQAAWTMGRMTTEASNDPRVQAAAKTTVKVKRCSAFFLLLTTACHYGFAGELNNVMLLR